MKLYVTYRRSETWGSVVIKDTGAPKTTEEYDEVRKTVAASCGVPDSEIILTFWAELPGK